MTARSLELGDFATDEAQCRPARPAEHARPERLQPGRLQGKAPGAIDDL